MVPFPFTSNIMKPTRSELQVHRKMLMTTLMKHSTAVATAGNAWY